ncbi:MAG: Nramp family divalent metal transporter [Psychroflexus sp.]
MKSIFKNIGPGTLVAAAFIGPGTITVCTLAGLKFGYNLLWALLFSILATMLLQEMSARLGLVLRQNLATAMRNYFQNPFLKYLLVTLVILAIVLGNSAYEAGNISGAVMGISVITGETRLHFGDFSFNYMPLILGVICFFILNLNTYKYIEKILIGLVILMSLSFVGTAIITKPDLVSIIKGLSIPDFPKDSLWTILAIIGTTIVPYNLFLHSSIVQEKWEDAKSLKFARWDTIIGVGLGGLVSICVVITAATIEQDQLNSILDLAKTLAPIYGTYAKYLLGFGFFAAGITSTITAALAAAYVLKACLGWTPDKSKLYFPWVWRLVLLLGVFFASFNLNPIRLIELAQISNAILLPFVALFLFLILSNSKIMKAFKNSKLQNVLAVIVIAFCFFLGVKSLFLVFQ